jgi:hypothetical protein
MRFEKVVCALCGVALIWNGAHPNIECQPRVEVCAPPVLHLPDSSHKDPAPMRTTGFTSVVSSTSSVSLSPESSVYSILPPR